MGLKFILIEVRDFLAILRGQVLVGRDDIPDDARVVSIGPIDHVVNPPRFPIIVESAEFPETDQGSIIPASFLSRFYLDGNQRVVDLLGIEPDGRHDPRKANVVRFSGPGA